MVIMQGTTKKSRRNHTNVRKYHGLTYTREQKIVATVWYHERLFTGICYEQLCQNFRTRFNLEYPSYNTLRRWEKNLFKDGYEVVSKKKKATRGSLSRWVYIPYVKESLIRNPDMSLMARAKYLGITQATLHTILKSDLKEFHLDILTNFKAENVADKVEVVMKNNESKDENTK